MMDSDYAYIFKLLILGDSSVGKTALMNRFVDNSFLITHVTTIGVDFKVRTIEVDGQIIKLQIWDTAGQERFRNILPIYYRGAHGIIIVYDVTNQESLDHVSMWHQDVERYASDEAYILLVGNKSDLQNDKVVQYSDAQILADSLGIQKLIETSAKKTINVEQAFILMASEIKARLSQTDQEVDNQTIRLGQSTLIEPNQSCCYLY